MEQIEIKNEGGRFVVVVDGKPVTGPLRTFADAEVKAKQEAERLGIRSVTKQAAFMIFIVCVLLGVFIGFVAGDFSIGLGAGAGAFLAGMIALLYKMITR